MGICAAHALKIILINTVPFHPMTTLNITLMNSSSSSSLNFLKTSIQKSCHVGYYLKEVSAPLFYCQQWNRKVVAARLGGKRASDWESHLEIYFSFFLHLICHINQLLPWSGLKKKAKLFFLLIYQVEMLDFGTSAFPFSGSWSCGHLPSTGRMHQTLAQLSLINNTTQVYNISSITFLELSSFSRIQI